MKKLFLAGALAASMAISSTAFAAVNYGESGSLGISVDETNNQVSVTSDLSSYDGQVTVLILNNDDGSVAAQDIIYIDQDASDAQGLFTNMGVLGTLQTGVTYTVKVGGENVAELLTKTFTIAEENQGTEVTLVIGDVDGDDKAALSDASSILLTLVGGSTDANGPYEIGEEVGELTIGDVDGDDKAALSDASSILLTLVGGSTDANGPYEIGESVTFTINN